MNRRKLKKAVLIEELCRLNYICVNHRFMKKAAICLVVIALFLHGCKEESTPSNTDWTTHFEASGGTETPTYPEVIYYYTGLAEEFSQITIHEMGPTDSGQPLHLVTYAADASITPFEKPEGMLTMLINNGIHPGESDGIDASMMLMRDLAIGTIKVPENVLLAVIPVYNVGGALNRNSGTRTNQNGPKEHGFRGNARNYDLNRDFIKADTRNARSFAEIFHRLNPDLFIDNHVSNGADYQYVLTHLFTQHNKLGGELGDYMHDTIMPALEDSLAAKDWDITPYVNVFNRVPEPGWNQFMDYPRYSSGYTTLFNSIGMMVETHMLKPYDQRVMGTYELMRSMIDIADSRVNEIANLRANAKLRNKAGDLYPVTWEVDTANSRSFNFKGYEGTMEASELTGAERLKYHRDQPFTRPVKFNDHYKGASWVTIPDAYVIPHGQWQIMDRLMENEIQFNELEKDSLMMVSVYHIDSFETYSRAYEGHMPHYNTKVRISKEQALIPAGSYWVSTQQDGVRYLLETLEPEATDSFFNWNYFDTILQQKEGFSPYVWEDKAMELLKNDAELAREFATKKAAEPDFAANWYAQLDWLHKRSENYERSHLRYPIVRVGG